MLRWILLLLTLQVALAAHLPWQGWLDQTPVRSPSSHRRLALFPLVGESRRLPRCLSLDQALRDRVLTVSEVSEGGEVNRLRLANHGERPVFIMAGEVLVGARQDRVLQHDLWLPGDSTVSPSAFCVEHGRWAYKSGSKDFASKSTLSNVKVRAAAQNGGQQEVWSSVDECHISAGTKSPTAALNALYEDPRLQRRIEATISALRDLPEENPEMNGVAVQLGERVVAIDLFPDRRIFLALWPKLLRSYALEAELEGQELGDLERRRVRERLEDLAFCRPTPLDWVGSGQLFRLSNGNLNGEALEHDDGLVHLQGLVDSPRPVVRPRPQPPRPEPSPWPPAIDLVKPKRR
jgi:hypothetical protein